MTREEAVPVLEGLIKKLDHLEVMDGGEARALYQAMRALRDLKHMDNCDICTHGQAEVPPGEEGQQTCKHSCIIDCVCLACGMSFREVEG